MFDGGDVVVELVEVGGDVGGGESSFVEESGDDVGCLPWGEGVRGWWLHEAPFQGLIVAEADGWWQGIAG